MCSLMLSSRCNVVVVVVDGHFVCLQSVDATHRQRDRHMHSWVAPLMRWDVNIHSFIHSFIRCCCPFTTGYQLSTQPQLNSIRLDSTWSNPIQFNFLPCFYNCHLSSLFFSPLSIYFFFVTIKVDCFFIACTITTDNNNNNESHDSNKRYVECWSFCVDLLVWSLWLNRLWSLFTCLLALSHLSPFTLNVVYHVQRERVLPRTALSFPFFSFAGSVCMYVFMLRKA